jgi:hypothetical protein
MVVELLVSNREGASGSGFSGARRIYEVSRPLVNELRLSLDALMSIHLDLLWQNLVSEWLTVRSSMLAGRAMIAIISAWAR